MTIQAPTTDRTPRLGDAETHIDAVRAIAVTMCCIRDALLSKGGIHGDPRLAQSIDYLAGDLERHVDAIEGAIFPGLRRSMEDA